MLYNSNPFKKWGGAMLFQYNSKTGGKIVWMALELLQNSPEGSSSCKCLLMFLNAFKYLVVIEWNSELWFTVCILSFGLYHRPFNLKHTSYLQHL